MTSYEFIKKMHDIPDEELLNMAKEALGSLCSTGGRSFVMTVPPKINDADMIFSELIKRYNGKIGESDKFKFCSGFCILPEGEE